MTAVDDQVGDYKPGSIRRIKLKNFLTYGDVDIKPGPRFNMVIGANGTGKSSILCAICLGLGGDPKLLGRADDARSFIMHEKNVALIELELTPHPGQPAHILQRKIDREKGSERGNGRGASTFYLNDQKVNVKDIQKLVKDTYHISIDNLCTFLPQDKVGNFSGFDQQTLLLETEKTLSGTQHLYHTHLELIEKEAELNSGDHNVDTVVAKLAKLNTERERFEREKERMEEREAAEKQAHIIRMKMMWIEFNEKREVVMNLKEERKSFKDKLKEASAAMKPLEEQQTALKKRKAEVDKKFKSLDLLIQKKRKEMGANEKKFDNFDENVDKGLFNINGIETERRQKQHTYEQHLEKVKNYEQMIGGLPAAEDINQAFEEAATEKRALHKEHAAAKKECTSLQNQFYEHESRAEQLGAKLAKVKDEKSQRKARVLRTNQRLQQACKWLDQNRKIFRRRVWGPIACEVSPKSANAAAFLEEHVPNATLRSFVVEDKADYDLLYNEVRVKLKVPINIIMVKNGNLQPSRRIYSDAKMEKLKKEHGVTGYLDESFTAPDAVMQALVNYAMVDRVLVGGEKTQQSIDDKGLLRYLSEPDEGQNKPQSSCIFASQGHKSRKYQTSISRYSKKQNTNIDDVQPAKILAPGVDPKVKERLEQDLQAVHEEMNKLRPSMEDAEKNKADLEKRGQAVSTKAKAAKDDKEKLAKIKTRLSQAKAKLADAEKELKADDSIKKREYMKKMMNALAQLVTVAENHGSCYDVMLDSTTTSAGSRVNKDVVTQLERTVTQAVAEKRLEYDETVEKANKTDALYKKTRVELAQIKQTCDEEAPIMDADGNDLPIKAELEALPFETVEEAELALEEVEQKINSSHYDPNAIRQYEDTLKEIDIQQAKLDQMQGNKDSLVQSIEQKRGPWENALENSVNDVNKLFIEYMGELGCTGEVRLKKGNEDSEDDAANFKQYGIEIRVSFRQGVKAQVLSAQVQSGGERSVSTIMYLMALQEMMVSPFRCVDEINQGLDERNERLVFRRIVANSTRPPEGSLTCHSGQYFLITPKLLPNLIDMETEATTVLVVTNGPYNFDSPNDFDDAIAGDGRRKRPMEAADDEENVEQNIPRRSKKNKKRRSSASAEDGE